MNNPLKDSGRLMNYGDGPSLLSPIKTDDDEIRDPDHVFISYDGSGPGRKAGIIGPEDLRLDPMGPGDLLDLGIESRSSPMYPYSRLTEARDDLLELLVGSKAVSMARKHNNHKR